MGDWNAALYDNKHDFVSEYGKGLLGRPLYEALGFKASDSCMVMELE